MSSRTIAERAAEVRRTARHALRAFYSRPLGWGALIVTSGVLAYGGGGAMFWFHAIYRGEAGPPINDWWHWFFDSSLGFMALTPALFFILPAAFAAVRAARIRGPRLMAAAYLLVVGVAFGVVTGPGPFLHDKLVGRGTWLARRAVDLFGYDPQVAGRVVHEHSTLSEMILQVVVGIPVYVLTGLIALALVRAMAAGAARARAR